MNHNRSIREIIDLMDSPSPEAIALITKAYKFADEAHKDHRRYSGEPYFVHLVETAKILAELGKGPITIAAGLLHDCVEDTGVSEETIEKEFGKEILFLIQGVTKLGQLRYRGVERHVDSLRKLFIAMAQDIRVLIIKLADRLHNMRTLEHVPEEKRHRIALETLEIYVPLAYRLGMRKLNRELEDLAFSYVYPEEYERVSKLIKEKTKESVEHLKKFHKSLIKVLVKAGVTHITSDNRQKNLYSLYKKLQRRNDDIEKIYDIAALRICVPTIADCYRVLGIVHGNWRPLPGRIKDYIAFPKPNGYRSIHTTVFTGDGSIVEVQIRTQEMHKEAEYGIASHLSYKYKKGSDAGTLSWFRQLLPTMTSFESTHPALHESSRKSNEAVPNWIRHLAETQDQFSEHNEFMDNLKADFFELRVFAFTPKGDVVDLPIGASPIDFAYAIHSDLGNHISGAKVNGKLVTLDTQIQNGDIVEIQSKKSAHPTTKWLAFTKTSLAKKHLKAELERLGQFGQSKIAV
ncbi:MAG TPA: RelA/SpoT family protein [Candidatus Paceibacterota bacterium]